MKGTAGKLGLAKEQVIRPIAVRVAALNYLVVLLLLTFFAAFMIYMDSEVTAYMILAISWISVPVLAFQDRVTFDGRRIRRTGLLPRVWAFLTNTRDRIKVNDVEMVQTNILRMIRRGGNHFYTYRTSFLGKGKVFVVNSGRNSYSRFLEAVLPMLDEELLDRQTVEIRDHFIERDEARLRARAAKIPSAEILENSLNHRNGRSAAKPSAYADHDIPAERALGLHRLANELRVSGLLPQAMEAFRRAVLIMPRDARLLFDYALCLRTYAGAQRDRAAERRALAMVRLAERRAGDDGELLARIGEGYFQFGEWKRASAVFKKAVERAGERFRTMIGLAEIALHEGKIAHVIHNFIAAGEIARTPSLRRWTKHEIDYFSRLNNDEEYMELEISRMNLLDTFEAVKRSSLRIAMVGFPAILLGVLSEDDLIANVGWAVSMIAFTVWAAMILLVHLLSTRIPFDPIEDD